MQLALQVLLLIALVVQILIWRNKKEISKMKNSLNVAAEDQRILAQRGRMTFTKFVKSFFKEKR